MKTLIHTSALIAFVLFTAANGFAGTHKGKKTAPEAPKACLDISGVALDENNQPINGVSVSLYKENSEEEWAEVTSVDYHDHAFSFRLDANEHYTIEISKDGYVTRSVSISTMIPSNISLKDLFHYEFEVSLFKENKNLDDYYLDFPVAIVSYDARHDVFDNSETYTKHIKTKLKEAALASNTRQDGK